MSERKKQGIQSTLDPAHRGAGKKPISYEKESEGGENFWAMEHEPGGATAILDPFTPSTQRA